MCRNFIFLFLIVMLSGCVINNPGTDSGTVEIDISYENQTRTIMYGLPSEEVIYIRIDFIEGPVFKDSIIFEIDENIDFSLISGYWNIEIYGINDSGAQIVFSEADFTVFTSQICTVTVELKPMINDTSENDASGSVDVLLDWSSVNTIFTDEVSVVTAVFGSVDETAADISSELDTNLSGGTAVFFKNPCPSGNYVIEFYLFDNNEVLIAYAAESVNVRDNLQTSGIIELEDADFNLNGIGIDISVDLPEVEIITFNYSNDVAFSSSEISAGVTVSVTNSSVFDSYSWSLYNHSLSSDFNSVTLPADLSVGVHHLTVYVNKDGDLLSGTFRFFVKD